MVKEIIFKQIKKQKKLYIITSIVFFVGVCLGVACINNLNTEILEKFKIYFNNFQKSIVDIQSTDVGTLFLNSFFAKFKYIGLIFLLACTIVGGTFIYVLVLGKGFSLGYIISAMIRVYGIKKGILFALTTLAIQNIIYIPCIIFFSVYSINFCKMIKTRNVDIKILLLKFFIIFFVILIISTLASTAELLISYKIIKKIQVFY